MSFRDRVYAVVASVPPGRVMGYGHVGAVLGSPRLARQVGWALASLPAGTDVPWHRILRSSGRLAFQGDPARALVQRALLEEEGVAFEADTVPMARFGWTPA
ncbi:MAG: MGMT family protein [Pseudomonadota bacterium]|nr:MGMT family protein [Pseudomonadota bacterium]